MPDTADRPLRILITDFVWPSTRQSGKRWPPGWAMRLRWWRRRTVPRLLWPRWAADCDGIMTCFAQVTPAVVWAAERCRVISRYGVGVDNIAVAVATELGIPVTYVPDYCVDESATMLMALLLAWNRQVGFYDRLAKAGRWEGAHRRTR